MMTAGSPLAGSPHSAGRLWLAVVAISACYWGLFVWACFLPAYRHPGWDTYDGLYCLHGGWIAPAWWANPLALVGWLLLLAGRHTAAAVVSTVAVGLALTTLIWFAATADELLAGYRVWQASFIALAVGCWLIRWLARLACGA